MKRNVYIPIVEFNAVILLAIVVISVIAYIREIQEAHVFIALNRDISPVVVVVVVVVITVVFVKSIFF